MEPHKLAETASQTELSLGVHLLSRVRDQLLSTEAALFTELLQLSLILQDPPPQLSGTPVCQC